MKVAWVAPEQGEIAIDELMARLVAEEPLAPFEPVLVEFAAALSRALTSGAELRAYPELVALGHWTRKASVLGYARELAALAGERLVFAPRGLVFHVPPANVDTIFVYSWLLSLWAGNVNLIRLPSRESPQLELLCAKLAALLAEPRFARVRRSLAIVRYGHEDAINRAISARVDMRVVWGGDATVAALRALPLAPAAHELSFGNRFSFSALATEPYLAAEPALRKQLAERFFNDALWFDQAGCASPRLVVWCGERTRGETAARLFFDELAQVVRARGFQVELGKAVDKLVFTYEAALDGRIAAQERLSGELSVLSLTSLADFDRAHPGAGLFFVAYVDALEQLVPFVTRRDQTLGHFGFAREELLGFVRRLAGRGIDRVVPLGQALSFHRIWDGYDLLQEFTRRVYVES